MAVYMLIFFAALGVAYIGTPVAQRVAMTAGFVKQPGGRHIHASPIPLLGGAAIYLGFVAALLIANNNPPAEYKQMAGIVVAATVLALFGLWDDRQSLRATIKLVGQVLAASIIYWSGIRVEFLHNPVLNLIATFAWLIGISNAINFLDNMDGLAGGTVSIASAFLFLLATSNNQILVASLSAALFGACLGFLRYNFNQARIFMGDAGALFLGMVLAAVAIKLRFENSAIVTWMIPVMVLGLPLFDTTLVVISRLRRRVNPFTTAGTDHTSHRLVRLGLSRREAVLVLYLICCAFGMASLFLLKASVFEGYFTGAVVAIICLFALYEFEFHKRDGTITQEE
jgi:UDP-GlcNAc:undecaprenyl-phosphate/decaprenyl-phosphate GlcNAc-1-phosphate transferase